jgi:hypothetical protein
MQLCSGACANSRVNICARNSRGSSCTRCWHGRWINRRCTGAAKRDRSPDSNRRWIKVGGNVKPGGVRRREVECIFVGQLERTVGFRFVDIEIIEDDVKVGVRKEDDDEG